VLNSFLPVILFLHSGYEIAERYPINTGLDFTPEDLKKLPSEKLPLFSEYGYNWLSKEHFTELVTKVLSIRKKYEMVVLDFRPQSFRVLDGGSEHVLAYARLDHSPKKRLAVVGNCNYASSQVASVRVDTKKRSVVDLLSGKRFAVKDDHVTATLAAGQSLVFEF
jgi:hypothetical protein